MKFFNLSSRLKQELLGAKTLEEKLCARTKIGKEEFSQGVRSAGLILLHPSMGLDVKNNAEALVVGIATYSDSDLEALDKAIPFLQTRKQVFIFDIDECLNLSDVQSVMPQATLFTHTPVVAVYDNGHLSETKEGKDAIDFLANKSE